MIALDGVRFVYPAGGVVALEGLTIDISAGQVVGVAGQNGSGKTTLAKLLNGILKPTAGSVEVAGRDTSRHTVQALASHVGYVFQNPNHQLFARTVAEELAFGPRNLGCTPSETAERVAEAVAFFGLDAVLRLHPYRISVPLRKLVAIASVFTMRPQVFVLDEPTTGQDHRSVRVIAGLIRRLGERGDTVVCVSHDMSLIADVADRVLVLRTGRLIADGSPRDVFADRVTMDSARVAPPPITRLSMQLAGRTGRRVALSVAELVADVRAAGTERA